MINELKISPSIVRKIVGHVTPDLTLSVYTHTSTGQQDEAKDHKVFQPQSCLASLKMTSIWNLKLY